MGNCGELHSTQHARCTAGGGLELDLEMEDITDYDITLDSADGSRPDRKRQRKRKSGPRNLEGACASVNRDE